MVDEKFKFYISLELGLCIPSHNSSSIIQLIMETTGLKLLHWYPLDRDEEYFLHKVVCSYGSAEVPNERQIGEYPSIEIARGVSSLYARQGSFCWRTWLRSDANITLDYDYPVWEWFSKVYQEGSYCASIVNVEREEVITRCKHNKAVLGQGPYAPARS